MGTSVGANGCSPLSGVKTSNSRIVGVEGLTDKFWLKLSDKISVTKFVAGDSRTGVTGVTEIAESFTNISSVASIGEVRGWLVTGGVTDVLLSFTGKSFVVSATKFLTSWLSV